MERRSIYARPADGSISLGERLDRFDHRLEQQTQRLDDIEDKLNRLHGAILLIGGAGPIVFYIMQQVFR